MTMRWSISNVKFYKKLILSWESGNGKEYFLIPNTCVFPVLFCLAWRFDKFSVITSNFEKPHNVFTLYYMICYHFNSESVTYFSILIGLEKCNYF